MIDNIEHSITGVLFLLEVSSMPNTPDFDDDYINELKSQGPEEDVLTATVADRDEALAEARIQAVQQDIAAKKAIRSKTYITSEIPVRPCTADCPHRGTCKDFISGRVEEKDLCKPELRKIKKWQVAFRKGNLEELKDDVGAVAGALAVQLVRLLEAVNTDGAVVETTKFVAGHSYNEKMAHPALTAASKLAKDLGIDLTNFLMTPKAVKENGPQVQVNIGISQDEVHARFAARFAKPDKVIDVEVSPTKGDDS
ncbi:hypothetical protein [Paenibacillus tyrfis]|uniref:hypothetical protein n=1 Tax=Paenibacillus tyrfis TaxID=1501230 RepID=UPI00209E4A36|nr:hypothetical protein [Paenibacillus tyrfis]MCP1306496.1 hypothetical protein [Paenibacillus tyrfis]